MSTKMRQQHVQGARPPQSESLTIGQLAERVGVSAKAIRYYESIGLLPQPPRGANSYRRYGAADVNRLRLLRRIRLLGVPLPVAKPLLAGASDARCADVQAELLALVEERLRIIDQDIAELHQLRAHVEGYQRTLSACEIETSAPFSACADMSCIALDSDAVPPDCSDLEERNDDCVLRPV